MAHIKLQLYLWLTWRCQSLYILSLNHLSGPQTNWPGADTGILEGEGGGGGGGGGVSNNEREGVWRGSFWRCSNGFPFALLNSALWHTVTTI